jgi:hypothetical protein
MVEPNTGIENEVYMFIMDITTAVNIFTPF